LQLAAAAAVGCGGGGGGDDDANEGTPMGGMNNNNNNGDTSATDTLRVVFSPMYSAFVPGHDSKIPVIVDGKTGADVMFTAADMTMVDIEKTAEGAMLTIRKAGTTTIRAKSGTETGSAKLTVAAYTEAEWEAGKNRYNNGNGLNLLDGGLPRIPPGGGTPNIMVNPDTACAACHGMASELGQLFGADIEHTPQQTGGYSDQEIINIITMAKKPTGVGQHTMIPAFIWQMFHKWNADETQRKGLIAYLRTITPKSQGALDFPRFFDAAVPRTPPSSDAGVPRSDAN
jgi:hypothetical protein